MSFLPLTVDIGYAPFLGSGVDTMSNAGGNRIHRIHIRSREEHHMIDTRESVITEALAVIDKALAEMLKRELISAVEVGDLLLDLRSLLSASVETTNA